MNECEPLTLVAVFVAGLAIGWFGYALALTFGEKT